MTPIATVVLFVIHMGGAFPVPFYDMTACEKAKIELKKLDKTLVTKCLVTQTILIKPDI
jgi:hypothetical protein